jgi:hypothetical protein
MVQRQIIFATIIFLLLFGVAGAQDLERTLPPTPPPPSAPISSTLALLGLSLLLTCIFVPLCLVGFVVFLLILVKILGVFRVKPTLLIGLVVRRAMSGGLKSLLWWLWLIVALPAGYFGVSTATRIIGIPVATSSRWVFAIAVCVSAAAVFVSLSGAIARRVGERMGGMNGMMKQAKAVQSRKKKPRR